MTARVLTFNWHESYVHLLAKLGVELDIVEKWKGGVYGWIRAFRPVPASGRLISQEEARENLRAGRYRCAVGHNLNDLLFLREYPLLKVLVFHNKLTTEMALSGEPVDRAGYRGDVDRLLAGVPNLRLVFISESKRADWGFTGEIILPGVDPRDYGGYAGDRRKILRVGNGLKPRDIMLGWSVQERVLEGIPSTLLGLNPEVPESVVPRDWDAYREQLRRHRAYLNTTLHPYEDGYNLAMLEAMATGMPVLSTAHPCSPIDDGADGFVSAAEAVLRERALALLNDPELARIMGRRARQKALDRFPIRAFLESWRRALDLAPRARPSAVPGRPPPAAGRGSGRRMRILMSYTSNPGTTAAYLEKALRKRHDLITYGPCVDERILRAWDLGEIRDRVRPHDLPYFTPDLRKVLDKLPKGWDPDLFLWVETGVSYPLEGVEALPCPSACWLIDTHLHGSAHLETAARFRHVFLAQKKFVEPFARSGIAGVRWLPLACDPEIHGRHEVEKIHEIAFVGSVTAANRRRNALLIELAKRFPVHLERCFLERMALVFSRSKIVFNCSARNDLNMRVFEAMASGSLLVTDAAGGSGLADLFRDEEHLVVYRSDAELLERVARYLEDGPQRQRIAAQGREEVLAKHTYEDRAGAMLAAVESPGRPHIAQGARRGAVGGCSWNEVGAGRAASSAGACAPERTEAMKERREVARLIPAESRRILDVGCGCGHLGKFLKERERSCEVWGVEMDPAAAREAEGRLDRVAVADACRWAPPAGSGTFDTIVFADVLEHTIDPKAVLERYLCWLQPAGSVVLSVPNARFWGVLQHLAEGSWTYQDQGILDRGHLRFFTRKEIMRLLDACGLEAEEVQANVDPRVPSVPPGATVDLELGRLVVRDVDADEARDFFVFQYLVRAGRKTEILRAEGQRLEAAGSSAEALAVHARLAARCGDPTDWVIRMCGTDGGAADRERVVPLVEQALRLHPAREDLLLAGARLFASLHRFERAAECVDRVLLFHPSCAQARALRDELPRGPGRAAGPRESAEAVAEAPAHPG
ncbi:MAG: glycosyltransferase [bacterium]